MSQALYPICVTAVGKTARAVVAVAVVRDRGDAR